MVIALLLVAVLLIVALVAAAGGLDRTRGRRRLGARRVVRETVVDPPVRRERVVERPVATEHVVEDYPPGA